MSPPKAPKLAPLLIPFLPEGLRGLAEGEGQDLEQALAEVMLRVAASGVQGQIPAEEFLAHLASRLPDGARLLPLLERLHVEDLALAWACGQGRSGAIEMMERRCFPAGVDAALKSMPDAAANLGEIKQLLRHRLLVADGERPPRITQYSGRGALRSWLRVAAIRCALNFLKGKTRREVQLDEEVLERRVTPEDPELRQLKVRYREQFKAAFETALISLETKERNLLAYHYLERLNIDQIGAIYDVHRATVARWLARIRRTLEHRTRRALMERLSVSGQELESIMRLIQSQLDASIERFLLASQSDDP